MTDSQAPEEGPGKSIASLVPEKDLGKDSCSQGHISSQLSTASNTAPGHLDESQQVLASPSREDLQLENEGGDSSPDSEQSVEQDIDTRPSLPKGDSTRNSLPSQGIRPKAGLSADYTGRARRRTRSESYSSSSHSDVSRGQSKASRRKHANSIRRSRSPSRKTLNHNDYSF